MRWIDLTPPDFRRAVSETGLCIVPVGSLERHGEHGYFGTDGVNAEALATKAAELEPAVVFPTWWCVAIKGDTVLPELQKEFLKRCAHVGK